MRCQVAFYGPMDLRTDDARTAPYVSADALAEHSPITLLERHGGNTQPLFIAEAGLDRPGINNSVDAFVVRATKLGGAGHPGDPSRRPPRLPGAFAEASAAVYGDQPRTMAVTFIGVSTLTDPRYKIEIEATAVLP